MEPVQTVSKSRVKIARHWSEVEPDVERCFFGFPPLRPYQIRWAFGERLAETHRDNPYWAEDIFITEYLHDHPVEAVLSLCCGFGEVERRFVGQMPGIQTCLAVDLAPGALETARQRAKDAGMDRTIRYVQADLNHYPWEAEKYDLVIANGALHHLADLETVITGIKATLKPGGILYANEHVGASYQDYPSRQLELINAAAYLVPPELRGRIGTPFRHSHQLLFWIHQLYYILRGDIWIPDPQARPGWSGKRKRLASVLRSLARRRRDGQAIPFRFGILHDTPKPRFLRSDPSECVRSADILPLIRRTFPDVEVHPYGGAILAYALDNRFYDCYDANNPMHRATLDLLCQLEEHYTQTGELGAEHAVIIARKPV